MASFIKQCKQLGFAKLLICLVAVGLFVGSLYAGGEFFTVKPRDSGKYHQIHPDYEIVLGRETFKVEAARTVEQHQRGLSFTPPLKANEGMIFVFEEPGQYCFWMKDMQYRLDILWFDEQQQLVYLQENLSPDTYPKSYCPNNAAKYVVEVKPGTIKRTNLKLGDSFTWGQ